MCLCEHFTHGLSSLHTPVILTYYTALSLGMQAGKKGPHGPCRSACRAGKTEIPEYGWVGMAPPQSPTASLSNMESHGQKRAEWLLCLTECPGSSPVVKLHPCVISPNFHPTLHQRTSVTRAPAYQPMPCLQKCCWGGSNGIAS